MTDCGFPIINCSPNESPREWGRKHGESFRDGIKELVEIRSQLMREKNPQLTSDHVERLAAQQWEITQELDHDIADELIGIREGAQISLAELVVLNNYTDFRDIQVDDQGCSLAYVNAGAGPITGQTWDMHGSAKNYVCCLEIETTEIRTIVFSVVGCVGMMGFNDHGCMLGVNNINTDGARPGAIWPAIVRKTLQQTELAEMASVLTDSRKTSGHNYLIAASDHGQMWEVAPECHEKVDEKIPGQLGSMFHTNHCLGELMKLRETKASINSTTHIRFGLLDKKIGDVRNFDQMYELMNDHENYPKSICSNFQTDSQDPAITCGGAVGHLDDGQVWMWRGDKMHDDNFVLHQFQLEIKSRA